MKTTLSSLCKTCGNCCKVMVLPLVKPLQKAVMEEWITTRGCEVLREDDDTMYVKVDLPCQHLNKGDDGWTCDVYEDRPLGCKEFDGTKYDFLKCRWKEQDLVVLEKAEREIPSPSPDGEQQEIEVKKSFVILEKARSHKYIKREGMSGRYQYFYQVPTDPTSVTPDIDNHQLVNTKGWVDTGKTVDLVSGLYKIYVHPSIDGELHISIGSKGRKWYYKNEGGTKASVSSHGNLSSYLRQFAELQQYPQIKKLDIDFDKTTKEERLGQATWHDIELQIDDEVNQITTSDPDFKDVYGTLQRENIKLILGNMRSAISSCSTYLAGDTVDLMHKFVSQTDKILRDIGESGNPIPEETTKVINKMCIDAIRKLIYQEIESNRQQFTDHGIRHVVKNILTQTEMLKSLESAGETTSARERLLAWFIMVNHDVGYSVPLIRNGGMTAIKASKEHPAYSQRIAEQQRELWDVGKVFTEEEYNRAMGIIATHASTSLDISDPIAFTTRIADNLSLFQKEKLPSMFKYIEGSSMLLLAMALAWKKDDYATFDKYKNELSDRIEKSRFSLALQRDLKAAIGEINWLTPKIAIGTLAGEVSNIGTSDKGLLSITIKHNKFDETLQKLFDMGQQRVKSLLDDYGIKDYNQNEYYFGKYGDKAVLEIKVEK